MADNNRARRPIQSQIKIVKFLTLGLRKSFVIDDKEDYANLSWSIRMGYPRINVYTSNVNYDKDKVDYSKIITAPFNYVTFMVLLNKMQEAIKSKEPYRYTIECWNTDYDNNKPTDSIVLQAKVHVGKDKDGIVYIMVIEDEKRKVKFDIVPPETPWHKYSDADKKSLSESYAQAYHDVLKKLMLSEMIKDETVVKTTTTDRTPEARTSVSKSSEQKEAPKKADDDFDIAGILD